jgi:lipopolysaccharide biosynthesis protein
MENKDLKIYSFFLPQFHECPFNNEWWGIGFTEWNNVKNGVPQFKGHHQPRVPLDGYYDLNNAQVLKDQFKNAKLHGIDGFVVYHYWYEGKRPLGKVMDTLLENQDIEGSFSPCWANHSWTRSWTNRMGAYDVLIEQTYEIDLEERQKHYKYLNCIFKDKRSIKIEDKPLFQIYRPELIPNLQDFIFDLRKYSKDNHDIDLHISALITGWQYSWEYLKLFDSATFFQPSVALFSPENIFSKEAIKKNNIDVLIRALPERFKKYLYRIQDVFFNKIAVFEYEVIWEKLINQYKATFNQEIRVFPSAFVDFDNSPRYKQRAKIMKGFSIESFGRYFRQLIQESKKRDSVVFINAWNEWGEGMHLEADEFYENQRLEEIRKIKFDNTPLNDN